MGKDFVENHETAAEVFARADSALGFSLSRIIFEGPEEELTKTAYTQPAILTVSIAIFEVLKKDLGVAFAPLFVAGHSLGEYTALVAAGTLSLEDGVRLVHLRGDLMQKAVPLGKGSMAAILGLDVTTVEAICREASDGEVCQPANDNAPGQVVISGHADAVERAVRIARQKGATKTIPLKVSAPFHCDLMRPVAEALRAAFEQFEWKDPAWPVVTNVDATPVSSVEDIQNALYRQTYSPVLWTKSVQVMAEQGVDAFIELGPGHVLSGLVKRTLKGVKTFSVSKLQEAQEVVGFLKGGEAGASF